MKVETLTCSGGSYMNPVDLITSGVGKLIIFDQGAKGAFHPNPCGDTLLAQAMASEFHKSANPPIATFGLKGGATHTTTITVAPNTARFTITANWTAGKEITSFTMPGGATYPATSSGPDDENYASYTVFEPAAGSWTLTSTNPGSSDSGSLATTVTLYPTVAPKLPPAGVITASNLQNGFLGRNCTATFTAHVNSELSNQVARYVWYDNVGRTQTASGHDDDQMTMTSSSFLSTPVFQIILKTIGVDGQVRYTEYQQKFADCK